MGECSMNGSIPAALEPAVDAFHHDLVVAQPQIE